jgi:hypothetical protein
MENIVQIDIKIIRIDVKIDLQNVPSTISPLGEMLVPLHLFECQRGIFPSTQLLSGQLAQPQNKLNIIFDLKGSNRYF